jgi:hypothetical protein
VTQTCRCALTVSSGRLDRRRVGSASLSRDSLLLLLLAWIPLAPLLTGAWFPFQHDVLLSDLLHVHVPYRVELHDRLSAGQLPQWWPDVCSGLPYLAQIETGVVWPHNLVFAVLDPPTGLNFVWLCNMLIAGLSGWFYARTLGAMVCVRGRRKRGGRHAPGHVDGDGAGP